MASHPRHDKPGQKFPAPYEKGRYAPPSSPYPPGLSWRDVKRRNATGSSRIPSRLAHHARPIRQYQADVTSSRLLPPSPATPGSGCLQLHPAATTARQWRSLTSIREQQRLTAHIVASHSAPGGAGGPAQAASRPGAPGRPRSSARLRWSWIWVGWPARWGRQPEAISRRSPSSRASPGSGCLQLHPAATTARQWRSLTSIREQQRLTAHTVAPHSARRFRQIR
jgi:hypothetical protein